MKKILSIISCSATLIASGGISLLSSCSSDVSRPLTKQVRQKREMNPNVVSVYAGDFRLQILDDVTVRFEYKYKNPIYGTYDWLDDDTLFVPNRTLYKGPTVTPTVEHDGGLIIVTFGNITITFPEQMNKDLKGIEVYQNGDKIYDSDYQIDDNTGELPDPNETGYVYEFVDTPRIIEPILGYSEDNAKIEPYKSYWNKGLKENCGFEIQRHKDIYLTFPNNNPFALRQQYRNLAGAPEMVRLSTLGAWDSRYYPYNEQTAQEEVDHYYENNLPLDNLIIDTDWRAGFDGKGYFVNEQLFPNMPRFLKSIHNQNIEVCFNDHPEPQKNSAGDELPVLDPKEVEFRRFNLDKIMDMGLDTWWYDRNWSTSLICPGGNTKENEAMLNHETWGDYLYNNVTKQQHLDHIQEKYAEYGDFGAKRPTVMSNVVQIRNGRWEQFTDSAAHRYSIQWTGDQTPAMLESEIQNVVKTGIRSMPYMSSDLAGHTDGVADDYYYQRWMEYGALSPIFRIHCTRDLEQHCQPWLRPENVLNTFRDWIQLRYRLLPLYYSLAREAYDTGMPICRSVLFYDNDVPEDYQESEYMIGSNILFAPCCVPTIDLKENDGWVNWKNGLDIDMFNNENLEGMAISDHESSFAAFADMRQYFKDHNLGEGGEGNHASARITGTFTPTEDRCVWIKSDDGVDFKIKDSTGKLIEHKRDWTGHSAKYLSSEVELKAGQTYSITIEYYNGTEGGSLLFSGAKTEKRDSEDKTVYLPEGQWMNVFTGEVSEGKKTVIAKCAANQNALFVKLGTMLPLINNAQNTKEFDWTNLVYDIYPSKTADPFASLLYEDDFETMAYQDGHYCSSNYECHYDSIAQKFIITLSAPSGSFIGDEAIANRTRVLRLHQIPNIKIGEIKINGNKVEAFKLAKGEDLMPFNFTGPSGTEDVYEVVVPQELANRKVTIEIDLGV